MSGRIERRLQELGIRIPPIQAPWANYVSVIISGSIVYLSGQLPSLDGVSVKGKLGADLGVDDGRKSARLCAVNLLPHLRDACGGNLDRVVRCIEIGGFVNATPDFTEHPRRNGGQWHQDISPRTRTPQSEFHYYHATHHRRAVVLQRPAGERYNALQVSAVKRLSQGLRAQVSYTFSRSVDDSSGINSQDYVNSVTYSADFYDRKYDRGLSAFFAAHVLTFNWTWDLPTHFLRGWQLNNITTFQTGHPFEVILGFDRAGNLNTTSFSRHERPDLKPGYSNHPILGGPDRYFDVNAFVLQAVNTRGNLGRNTLIGPGLANSDFALDKVWRLREALRLQFRGEVFNFVNHPNFAVPSGRTAFTGITANGAPVVAPDWGRITRTVATSRQIQFGLKLSF